MSGWLISILLALAAGALLFLFARPRGGALQLVVAALIFGLAGYAWQGSPDIGGSPARRSGGKHVEDSLFAHERTTWLETVGPSATQLDGADALIHNGDPDYAAGILRAGLARDPGNMMLWLGYGNALQSYADGLLTPAARYAFDRAHALAPDHPAPDYFLGLAYLQMGDLDGAEAVWRGLLARAPADAAWRSRIAQRIELVERFRKPG